MPFVQKDLPAAAALTHYDCNYKSRLTTELRVVAMSPSKKQPAELLTKREISAKDRHQHHLS